jgi:hypothetical protein
LANQRACVGRWSGARELDCLCKGSLIYKARAPDRDAVTCESQMMAAGEGVDGRNERFFVVLRAKIKPVSYSKVGRKISFAIDCEILLFYRRMQDRRRLSTVDLRGAPQHPGTPTAMSTQRPKAPTTGIFATKASPAFRVPNKLVPSSTIPAPEFAGSRVWSCAVNYVCSEGWIGSVRPLSNTL